GRARCSCIAPQLQQARADQRILRAVAGVEIPGVARAARTAAWLVVRQLGARARVVGLLRLPCNDPAFDVNFPRARAGAVYAVRRANDLVVLPALSVTILPATVFARYDSMSIGEVVDDAIEERQAIEEMAHQVLQL